MHECSFAQSVYDTVISLAKKQHATEIKKVVMSFGTFTRVQVDQFQFCFDLVKTESEMTRNTELEINWVPGELKCQRCGFEGQVAEPPQDHSDLAPIFPCPTCDSYATEILSGTETTIDSIVV